MLIEAVAVVLGVCFMFLASLGVLRLGDFYARIHAPTKAATLGLVFLLAALAFEVQDKAAVTKAVLAMLFVGMTAPVGAHILARSAYRRGVRPSARVDEYAHFVAARKTRAAPRGERGAKP
ncbi:monovalent cation/H(+) antiporter subunit G [Polyangium mundeleinium]|uniref:Monovalent cation/H(+) antiporter subunit G n=1 Tax=Polyangium mundeleinium TaxID=2995306 RepID=A0ABT5EXM7_9BACT|nr:monovalent cation/H(+) antiporter subunit G [Polyangium mundeleinium]MDC0746570.1 monovalent cation/H(+) antiporter subunit G [Polyangium mundeleinium]